MFSECLAISPPYVSNNMGSFPGGFLITKLSKLAPCSCGDALLLGRSLSGCRSAHDVIGGADQPWRRSGSWCLQDYRKNRNFSTFIAILPLHINAAYCHLIEVINSGEESIQILHLLLLLLLNYYLNYYYYYLLQVQIPHCKNILLQAKVLHWKHYSSKSMQA